MEDLQLVLFILGAIAIIAVLVHGFWSIRKQQPKSYKNSATAKVFKQEHSINKVDADGFDNDGIGEVRVRRKHRDQVEPKQEAIIRQEPVVTSIEDTESQMELSLDLSSEQVDAVKQDKIEVEQSDKQEIADDLMSECNAKETSEPNTQEIQDVLVLHVVAKEGKLLQGAELLPCLLSLNFKYGDKNIFHRHEDNAGTGEVLFSLANMVKPGIFDPDNMEQFTTHGVVLFMTLPNIGDPIMNFSIMLNSAYQLVDDLDAVLLDGQREIWNNNIKHEYVERIRAVIK